MKYVALLRGINVGGKQIHMKTLSGLLERLGYENVKTILASGNVVFHSSDTSIEKLVSDIETAIKKHFKFDVSVQVKSYEDIDKILKDHPFSSLTRDKNTHWYATFLDRTQKLPEYPSSAIKLLGIKHNVLFSTLDRTSAKTTDFMTFLDKQFGKKVTTRNWNTILKIARI